MNIETLKKKVIGAINKTQTLGKLEEIYRTYLGKRGEIPLAFNKLKKIPLDERKRLGRQLNEVKKDIEAKINKRKRILSRKRKVKVIDVSLPGKKISIGYLHPLTQILWRCEEIFEKMGFSVVKGPEIEEEWYNFDALNIPKSHPSRDLWDTLWIHNKRKKRLLLRTHTSPVQVRYMEKNNPPLRIIVPGKVFRYEATDPSHEIQFYQLEGLMVDKKVSVANFKALIQGFLNEFFTKNILTRIRPGYFPFTEPSFEVDIKEPTLKGHRKEDKWVELMGAGLVHPNVLKAARLNPKNWQGFAFGMGIDRLTMMKHKIDDIRSFYKGDLRFLTQF